MQSSVAPPFSNFSFPTGGLRSSIIAVLGEKWPLNARQLYSSVRELSPNVTYQGVHKALRLLVGEGVVVVRDRKYSLNLAWVREVRLGAESIERSYSGTVATLSYLHAGTGVSSNTNAFLAGKQAAENAVRELAQKPDFAFVFCHGGTFAKSDESIAALVAGVDGVLKSKNPQCKWVGCTTDGEVSDKGCFFNSCSVLALKSDHLFFGVGVGDNAGKGFFAAGKAAAAKAAMDLTAIDPYIERYSQFLALKRRQPHELLKTRPYLLLTVFPGPTRTYAPNEEELLRGIQSVAGITPLYGGSSSDSAVFRQTYQFANGKAFKDACIVVSMLSDLKLAFSVKHGLVPTRKQALVSKAVGNRVFTLSGKPAAKAYAKMLGLSMPELKRDLFDIVIRKPFGIADPLGHYWIKTPFHINAGYSLDFLNKVPQNALAVLMNSNAEGILGATKSALADLKEKLGVRIPVVILFDCGSRPRALRVEGKPPNSEEEILKKELPGSKIIGFYTHGEQALIPSGTVGQHNQTIIAIGISNELIIE